MVEVVVVVEGRVVGRVVEAVVVVVVVVIVVVVVGWVVVINVVVTSLVVAMVVVVGFVVGLLVVVVVVVLTAPACLGLFSLSCNLGAWGLEPPVLVPTVCTTCPSIPAALHFSTKPFCLAFSILRMGAWSIASYTASSRTGYGYLSSTCKVFLSSTIANFPSSSFRKLMSLGTRSGSSGSSVTEPWVLTRLTLPPISLFSWNMTICCMCRSAISQYTLGLSKVIISL